MARDRNYMSLAIDPIDPTKTKEENEADHCMQMKNLVNQELCHAAGFGDYGLAVEFLEADMKKAGIV